MGLHLWEVQAGVAWCGHKLGLKKIMSLFYPFFLFFPKTFSAQCPLGKFWSWCRWHCFEVQVAPAEVYQMCLALHRDTGRRDPTCTVVIPTTRKSMLLVTSYRSKAALGHFVLSATSMQTIQHAKPFRAGWVGAKPAGSKLSPASSQTLGSLWHGTYGILWVWGLESRWRFFDVLWVGVFPTKKDFAVLFQEIHLGARLLLHRSA